MNPLSRRGFLSVSAASLLAGEFDPAFADAPDASGFHPDFKPDPRIDEILRDLAAPLHCRSMRDHGRAAADGKEADLSHGYSVEIVDRNAAGKLATSLADFGTFMSVSMEVEPHASGYAVRLRVAEPARCPAGAQEAFGLQVAPTVSEITARDVDGLRRGLIYLEDEMLARGGPFLPLGAVSRWAVVEDRITRSPVAPYRWLSGWELEHDADYYPDEYLNKLAHCGMNGIWVAGLLSRLVASRTLPELGPPSHRLEKLKRLVVRAGRYGIRVYLFLIEPRVPPADHPVLAAHPEIRGAGGRALCTSTPLVQKYIREVMRELFTEVPDLAGVINIYNGERPTTCWLDEKFVQSCPRCRVRPQVEVLAEDLNCFMDGIREASTTAKLLAWGYSGTHATDFTPFMKYLHKDVVWLGNFEHEGEKIVHGKPVTVHEYSLSSVGPSESFAHVTRELVQARRPVYAKLQLGTTYELSSVPYVPVPQVVYAKLASMRELGVKGAMISWIIGGYPSPLLKVAGEASFAPLASEAQLLTRAAAGYWGPAQAGRVVEAWGQFSRAFQLYLCAIEVFYFGPIARCPAYHLHLERESQRAAPYNWGLTRARQKQPFEDKVPRWLGPFKADEVIASFREMGGEWSKGEAILAECVKAHPGAIDLQKQHAVAAAARIQFLSAANVIEFFTLRGQLPTATPDDQRRLVQRMRVVAEDDTALAEQIKSHVRLDCTIGFQSEIYDYCYTEAALEEKIRHDRLTLEALARWEETGVEPKVLAAVLPVSRATTRPAATSWRDWLRWGD